MLPAGLARFRRSKPSTMSTEAVIVWRHLQCVYDVATDHRNPWVVCRLRGCGDSARWRLRTS